MLAARKWNLIVTSLIALSGCEQALFKAPPKFVESQGGKNGGAQSILITTHSLRRASTSQKGLGEVRVTSRQRLNVTCSDCPGLLPLRFEEKSNVNGDAFLYVAPFSHEVVEQTEICRITLQFEHLDQKASEAQHYGVYFCPIDESTNQAVCNKTQAKPVCG